MIYEFAVNPNLFATLDDARFLIDGLKFEHGRVVSDYPENWAGEVAKLLTRHPVKRKRLRTWLEQLATFVNTQRRYDRERSWPDNVRAIQASRLKFHAVIDCDVPQEECILDALTFQPDDPLWDIDRQIVVERSYHRELARPSEFIFLHASKIQLVDPYFDPGDETFQGTLRAFLGPVAKRSRKAKPVIELHTCCDRQGFDDRFWDHVQTNLPSCFCRGQSLDVFLWATRPEGERFHARYVLSNIGGIEYEGGLGKGRSGQTTNVSLLTDKHNKRRRFDYQESTSRFKLVKRMVIVGTRGDI
jgi:hypothetical protein